MQKITNAALTWSSHHKGTLALTTLFTISAAILPIIGAMPILFNSLAASITIAIATALAMSFITYHAANQGALIGFGINQELEVIALHFTHHNNRLIRKIIAHTWTASILTTGFIGLSLSGLIPALTVSSLSTAGLTAISFLLILVITPVMRWLRNYSHNQLLLARQLDNIKPDITECNPTENAENFNDAKSALITHARNKIKGNQKAKTFITEHLNRLPGPHLEKNDPVTKANFINNINNILYETIDKITTPSLLFWKTIDFISHLITNPLAYTVGFSLGALVLSGTTSLFSTSLLPAAATATIIGITSIGLMDYLWTHWFGSVPKEALPEETALLSHRTAEEEQNKIMRPCDLAAEDSILSSPLPIFSVIPR